MIDDTERLGLALRNHKLLWYLDGGALFGWPMWMKRLVVTVWNWIACRIYDHDVLHLWDAEERWEHGPVCISCCKEWTTCPGCGSGNTCVVRPPTTGTAG